jgi:uncharacterized membrane protein YfcA
MPRRARTATTGKDVVMEHIWAILAVVVAAAMIQGIAGFGFGLFAMGLLVLFMPVTEATVVSALVSSGTTLVNLWTVRHDIEWREVWPILITAVPATVVGIFLLTSLPVSTLQIGIAISILLGCVVALLCPNRAVIQKAMPWAPILGLLGGLFSGALSMGGPPIALYALLRAWEKKLAKGVMASYFIISLVLRMVVLTATGVATGELWTLGLLLMPPTLLAAYLGTRIFGRMSNRVFRYVTTAILVALAVNVLLP